MTVHARWKLCNIYFSSRNIGLKCPQNGEEEGDSRNFEVTGYMPNGEEKAKKCFCTSWLYRSFVTSAILLNSE